MLQSPKPAPQAKDLCILAAEDIPVNQFLLSKYLEILGCEHDMASNGEEAVEMFESARHDAVLMDIRMPKLEGLEAMRLIVEQTPEEERKPFVAVTADASATDCEQLLNEGFVAVITKPFQLEELAETLEQLAKDRCAKT